MSNDAEFDYVDLDVGEVHLHCALAGPKGGELVVLLHGFPECAKSWRLVQRALAARGYRVVAPDMRGYGGSDKPSGVSSYATPRLVGDVAGLVKALGAERAHIVGHDWGGVVAWWTAMLRPDVVDRLAIVNAPHPIGYAAAMRTPAQLKRGWYVFFFQLPWLPQWALGAGDYLAVRRLFARDGVAPGDIDACVESLRQPGVRSAAIGYYRAAVRAALFGNGPKPAKIERPTLVVWGERDRFLVPELAEPPRRWVPGARVVRLPDATHWAHIDAAEAVTRALVAHFTERATAAA